MGLGFFVLILNGHHYTYHDGDQRGFSSEMVLDPARQAARILAVNTTNPGAPPPPAALHPNFGTVPHCDVR